MTLYEFECAACGSVFDDFAPMGARSATCRCGGEAVRRLSAFSPIVPMWMSDDAFAARSKHREWLKTPEAKKMDLQRVPWE